MDPDWQAAVAVVNPGCRAAGCLSIFCCGTGTRPQQVRCGTSSWASKGAMNSRENWVGLESNPAVMTQYAQKLGVSESWAFSDCWGLEEEGSQALLELADELPGAVPLEAEVGDAMVFNIRTYHSAWGDGHTHRRGLCENTQEPPPQPPPNLSAALSKLPS